MGRYSTYSTQERIESAVNRDFSIKDGTINFTNELFVEDIETPEFLYGPSQDQTLVKIGLVDNFSTDLLKVAFVDARLGKVWMRDVEKVNKHAKESKSSEAVSFTGNNSFYVELMDGTAQSYKLVINKSELLNIEWNSGGRLKKEEVINYGETEHIGCGTSNVVDVFMGNMDELAITGKNSIGQDIYEYKDKNNKSSKYI